MSRHLIASKVLGRHHQAINKARLITKLPRAFRPRLDSAQVRDLALVHVINLDTILRGEGDLTLLMHWVEAVFLWSKVAEILDIGVPEMTDQLHLAHCLIHRYDQTGKVEFAPAEAQAARDAVDIMDQLARLTDQRTAAEAADWSEAKLSSIRAEVKSEGEPA